TLKNTNPMHNNDDLSEQLKRDDDRTPKSPSPPRCDHSDEEEDADSSPSFRCDQSSATQGFLREQRGKLLKLIESSPQDIERIRDIYHTHLAGQFHVIGNGEWTRFGSLVNGLHTLDDSFHKGS